MTAQQAPSQHQATPAGEQRPGVVIGAERHPTAAQRILATRLRPLVAEDYDALGHAFCDDAAEAARLGADRAADTYLRRARACWWTARQLRHERTDHAEP
ncbi:MAG: hypothetical protein KY454_09290 [Actinobacteria bacterium]|nr:hypothetical protein [Actinomycetota bacterium]